MKKKHFLAEKYERLTGRTLVETKSITESVEDDITKWFDELVPHSGPADTVEGEMVRAINRIWYRYSNDGDIFFNGYGAETAGPAVAYLTDSPNVPGHIRNLVSDLENEINSSSLASFRADWLSNEEQALYENEFLKPIANAIVKHLESVAPNFTPNQEDLFDYSSKYEDLSDEYDDEYDGEEYDEEGRMLY